MLADNAKCCSCGKKMFVTVGTDVCPKCNKRGTLSWVNENVQEVDVSESRITK